MIEVTAEMLNAYEDGAELAAGERVRCYGAGLTAVLAIVERDHPEIERARQDEIEAGWSETHAQAAQDAEPF